MTHMLRSKREILPDEDLTLVMPNLSVRNQRDCPREIIINIEKHNHTPKHRQSHKEHKFEHSKAQNYNT